MDCNNITLYLHFFPMFYMTNFVNVLVHTNTAYYFEFARNLLDPSCQNQRHWVIYFTDMMQTFYRHINTSFIVIHY